MRESALNSIVDEVPGLLDDRFVLRGVKRILVPEALADKAVFLELLIVLQLLLLQS